MIIRCFYNQKTNFIVTISNKHIKNIEYEITCYEYDKLYKKIYLDLLE